MLESFRQPDEEFFNSFGDNVKLDAAGNVFIHLKNAEVIGLSPLSLSELLKVPIIEAKTVMKEAVKIAVESDIQCASEMSDILMKIMEIIDQSKEEDEIESAPIYIKESLLSVSDIAEILDINNAFTEKIIHSYKKPINSEEDLESFTDFVAVYINKHHMGHFPEEAEKDYTGIQTKPFDANSINTILSQEAPKELRSEEDIKSEQYAREAKATLKEVLSITDKDADMLLGDPHILQEFLSLSSKQKAQNIIQQALSGNQSPLMEALHMQSHGLMEQLSDHAIRDVLDPSNMLQPYSDSPPPSPSTPPTKVETPTIKIKQKPKEPVEEMPPIIETPPVSDDVNDSDDNDELPESLEATLRLCFDMRGRITSKTLSDIFEIWGTTISMAMARFIIEEGHYGGTGEDKKRIVTNDQLERLISDITAAGDIKTYLRKYLKMVNDQVQNMYYGGGKG